MKTAKRTQDKRRQWRKYYGSIDSRIQGVVDKLYRMGISYQQWSEYGVTEINARASAEHQVRLLKHLNFEEVGI